MKSFLIEGTEDTPRIALIADTGLFIISGTSIPEDVEEFFKPVFKWLDEYLLSPNHKTLLEFRLEYFNTASSKLLLEMLRKIEPLNGNGKELQVKWYYEEDDEEMEAGGMAYTKLTKIPIEMVVVNS